MTAECCRGFGGHRPPLQFELSKEIVKFVLRIDELIQFFQAFVVDRFGQRNDARLPSI